MFKRIIQAVCTLLFVLGNVVTGITVFADPALDAAQINSAQIVDKQTQQTVNTLKKGQTAELQINLQVNETTANQSETETTIQIPEQLLKLVANKKTSTIPTGNKDVDVTRNGKDKYAIKWQANQENDQVNLVLPVKALNTLTPTNVPIQLGNAAPVNLPLQVIENYTKKQVASLNERLPFKNIEQIKEEKMAPWTAPVKDETTSTTQTAQEPAKPNTETSVKQAAPRQQTTKTTPARNTDNQTEAEDNTDGDEPAEAKQATDNPGATDPTDPESDIDDNGDEMKAGNEYELKDEAEIKNDPGISQEEATATLAAEQGQAEAQKPVVVNSELTDNLADLDENYTETISKEEPSSARNLQDVIPMATQNDLILSGTSTYASEESDSYSFKLKILEPEKIENRTVSVYQYNPHQEILEKPIDVEIAADNTVNLGKAFRYYSDREGVILVKGLPSNCQLEFVGFTPESNAHYSNANTMFSSSWRVNKEEWKLNYMGWGHAKVESPVFETNTNGILPTIFEIESTNWGDNRSHATNLVRLTSNNLPEKYKDLNFEINFQFLTGISIPLNGFSFVYRNDITGPSGNAITSNEQLVKSYFKNSSSTLITKPDKLYHFILTGRAPVQQYLSLTDPKINNLSVKWVTGGSKSSELSEDSFWVYNQGTGLKTKNYTTAAEGYSVGEFILNFLPAGTFELSKEVASPNDDYKNYPFHYTLTDPAGKDSFIAGKPVYGEIQKEGQEPKEVTINFDNNAVGEIDLKHGEKLVIQDLPDTIKLNVKETPAQKLNPTWSYNNQDFKTQTDTEYPEVDINENETSSVYFKNTDQPNVAKVEKIAMGNLDTDKEYKFTLNTGTENDGTYKMVKYEGTNGTETSNTNLNIVDGQATFTLTGDEYVLITGLPIGDFNITETDPGTGIVTSWRSDGKHNSGREATDLQITKDKAFDVTFVNEKTDEGLVITKTLTGNVTETDKNKEFTYEITNVDNDGNVNEDYDFKNVNFFKNDKAFDGAKINSGVATVNFKADEVLKLTKLNNGEHFQVKEINHDGYTVSHRVNGLDLINKDLAQTTIEDNHAFVHFYNHIQDKPETPNHDVIIGKTASANVSQNKEFKFNIHHTIPANKETETENQDEDPDADTNPITYQVFDIVTGEQIGTQQTLTFNNDNQATLILKKDQKAVITGLHPGDYNVNEVNPNTSGMTTAYIDESGNGGKHDYQAIKKTVTADHGFTLIFHNQLAEEHPADLTISKEIKGNYTDTQAKQDFNFMVTKLNNGKPDLEYNQVVNAVKDNQATKVEFKDGVVHIVLKPGQAIHLTGLAKEATYTVQEQAEVGFETKHRVDGYELKDGQLVTVDKLGTAVTFYNIVNNKDPEPTPEPGKAHLMVQKRVAGDQADKQKSFDFTINLKDKNNQLITGQVDTTNHGKVTFDQDGNYQFKLKNQENIIFVVPEGAKYTVTETDYSKDGYQTLVTLDGKQSYTHKIAGTASGTNLIDYLNWKDDDQKIDPNKPQDPTKPETPGETPGQTPGNNNSGTNTPGGNSNQPGTGSVPVGTTGGKSGIWGGKLPSTGDGKQDILIVYGLVLLVIAGIGGYLINKRKS